MAYCSSAERNKPAAQCIVGSDMKFYLIALDDGSMLYFPSMSSL